MFYTLFRPQTLAYAHIATRVEIGRSEYKSKFFFLALYKLNWFYTQVKAPGIDKNKL